MGDETPAVASPATAPGSGAGAGRTDASGGFGRVWIWTLLALLLLFSAAVRFRVRSAAFERDEGEFAYAGQLLLQGIPPYQLAYNMKFPGVYLAYAAIMAVFGQTVSGVHLGFIFVNASGIVLVYLLGARLSGRTAGLVAAAIYTYASLSQGFLGTSAHATQFVVAAALGGLLLLLRSLGRRSLAGIFFSGVLLGISVLMKQHGLFFAAFAGLYLLYRGLAPTERNRLVRNLVAFGTGVFLPLGLTGLWLWRAGVFAKFWFWTILYAREYASEYHGLPATWQRISHVAPGAIWILLGASVPALVFLWRRGDRSAAVFATGLLAFSVAAVLPGFNFWAHYFILPLPAASLLSAVAVASAAEWFRLRGSKYGRYFPFVLCAGTLAWGVFRERELFFNRPPADIPRLLYGSSQPFPESIPVAEYLKAHTQPDARIAVLGSEPQIYFYARRHSATGYIYAYGLMEPQPYAGRMQQEMIGEIEAARPEYLVWVRLRSSWIPYRDSDLSIIKWAQKYLTTRCQLVGAVDMTGDQSVYYWDGQAPAHEEASAILVYRRVGPD